MTIALHDLVLHGGRVIDPAQGIDGRFDVAIKDGRIAAIAANIDHNNAAATIDVRGKLVLPGLIDTHAHVFRYMAGPLGLDADWVGVQSGVTALIEQGGVSAATLPGYIEYVVKAKANRVFAFLAPYIAGAIGGFQFPDQFTPATIDSDLILRAFAEHPDVVKGMKFWAEQSGLLRHGTAAIEKVANIARQTGAPIYVHLGALWPVSDDVNRAFPAEKVLETVLPFLRAGDIFAHPYTNQPGGYFEADGSVRSIVRDAIASGIKVDLGFGTATTIRLVRSGLEQGFMPDTLGADIHGYNSPLPDPTINPLKRGRFGNSPGVVNGMNLLMACGLQLEQVVPMATRNPARIFLKDVDGIGTLAPGAIADISVLNDERGQWQLRDVTGDHIATDRLLQPAFCLRAGQRFDADLTLFQLSDVA